jgi:hypothetical protein
MNIDVKDRRNHGILTFFHHNTSRRNSLNSYNGSHCIKIILLYGECMQYYVFVSKQFNVKITTRNNQCYSQTFKLLTTIVIMLRATRVGIKSVAFT